MFIHMQVTIKPIKRYKKIPVLVEQKVSIFVLLHG